MWELGHTEGWVPKNWCFRAVLLEKTLEHPLYSKEIKPVNLKEISPEYSLKGLRLKLPAFGHLMPLEEEPTHWKIPWCWGRLRVGGEGGNRGWDGWMVSPTQWTWVWANSGRQWRTGKSGVYGVAKTQLSDWTTTKITVCGLFSKWRQSFLCLSFIEIWLIYNVVLIIALQQMAQLYTQIYSFS